MLYQMRVPLLLDRNAVNPGDFHKLITCSVLTDAEKVCEMNSWINFHRRSRRKPNSITEELRSELFAKSVDLQAAIS